MPIYTKAERVDRLLPKGIPRYVRCYDNGDKTADRYTVCFIGRYQNKLWDDGKLRDPDGTVRPKQYLYLSMNAAPCHPQGIGLHGNHTERIDVDAHGFPPPLGGENHLGKRIRFQELPEDCKKLVLQDYKDIWDL